MSRISKIFNSNSDSSESDYSDVSDLEDLEELDELEDLDDLEELENDDELENELENEDDREVNELENDEDDIQNQSENEDLENEDLEKENDESDHSDIESDESIEYDDYDDFEENGLLISADDYTDTKIDKVSKKSKVLKNALQLEHFKSNKRVMQLEDVRVPSTQFLEKLLKNKTNAERLEKAVFNHVVRFFKKENIKLTLKSPQFRHKYSHEIFSIMSLSKSKMTFLEIKSKFDEDLDHFSRGTYKSEKINDEKKLRLITHVSEPVSGIHKCKCGCDKVYSYELQIRSGDEGMTVFLQCSSCGKKWRT